MITTTPNAIAYHRTTQPTITAWGGADW